MASTKNIWFHLGHAIERARHRAPSAEKAVAGRSDLRGVQKSALSTDRGKDPEPILPSADDLMSAGVALMVDWAIGGWGKRREPDFSGLVRAGAAGGAAALLLDLVGPLLQDDAELPVLDRGTADRLIAGVCQGLVYGAAIEPRLPGPALVKGVVFASAEYVAYPVGGLSTLLGSHSPHNRLPIVGEVLDRIDNHDRAYLEHLIFGIALALIYESSPSSSGIRPDDE